MMTADELREEMVKLRCKIGPNSDQELAAKVDAHLANYPELAARVHAVLSTRRN